MEARSRESNGLRGCVLYDCSVLPFRLTRYDVVMSMVVFLLVNALLKGQW